MTPARLAYFSECVRRHTNIVPSLAAEALAHIQAQAAAVERLRGALNLVLSISNSPRHPGDRGLALMPDSPLMDEVRAALKETTP